MGRDANNKTQVIAEQCDTLRPAENRGNEIHFSFLLFSFSFPFFSRKRIREGKEKKERQKKYDQAT